MKSYWYDNGLHFECMQCGRCCAGPAEGYIWVSRPEIKLVANYLKETVGQVRKKFLRRVGLGITIIEHQTTKDCIFLQESSGQRICMIYPVRPSQCRMWPFWPSNLASACAWNKTAQKCPGINRGRHYSREAIEEVIREKKWWRDPTQTNSSSQK